MSSSDVFMRITYVIPVQGTTCAVILLPSSSIKLMSAIVFAWLPLSAGDCSIFPLLYPLRGYVALYFSSLLYKIIFIIKLLWIQLATTSDLNSDLMKFVTGNP